MRRLIAKLSVKIASATLDQFARARILEGAAGVPPFSWVGKGAEGGSGRLSSAFDKAAQAFPDLDERWFSPSDQGVYRSMIRGALRVNSTAVDPDVIAQEILAGFSRADSVVGGQLYDVGRNLARRVREDQWLRAAQAWLGNHARLKALDALRKVRPEEVTAIRITPGEVEEGERFDVPMTPQENHALDALSDLFRSRNPAVLSLLFQVRKNLDRPLGKDKGKMEMKRKKRYTSGDVCPK